jgi:DNA polymerase-3 subunit alpha
MFDLWGETTALPTSKLEIPSAEISTKEKLAWEKELMGVYLSEHPFSSFAGKGNAETSFCGQIDSEMDGQTLKVAGMVASVSHLFTRDHRPFASVILEDLDGQVKVMVWSKVYESTKDLWEEGNIVLVEGKVRLRNDQVQLNCDGADHYQPDNAAVAAAPTIPQQVKPVISEAPVMVETPAVTPLTAEKHRLVISIVQTSNQDNDIARLRRLVDTIKDFSGEDEVTLRVKTEDGIEDLKLDPTGYCTELHQRLVELVGDGGLVVESGSQ